MTTKVGLYKSRDARYKKKWVVSWFEQNESENKKPKRYSKRFQIKIEAQKFQADKINELKRNPRQNRPVFIDPPLKLSGYNYLLQYGNTNIYKIGRTRNLKSRISTLQVSIPIGELYIRCAKYNKNPAEREQILHKRFAIQRIKGEWFKLKSEDINFIKKFIKCQDIRKFMDEHGTNH